MSGVKSFFNFSAITLLSKASGLIRDILLSAAFGVSGVSDAFFIAYKIPNILRAFIAEGTINTALAPMYIEKSSTNQGKSFINRSIALLSCISILFCILLEFGMPVLTFILAPGLEIEGATFNLCVYLGKIMAPYVVCLTLYTTCSVVLQERKSFGIIAFAPIILNIGMIYAISSQSIGGIFLAEKKIIATGVARSVIFAGIAQVIFIWAYASFKGKFLIRPSLRQNKEENKEFAKRALPIIATSILTRYGIWVDTVIASMVPGLVSYLYYAERIYYLPRSIIGVSIGTVLLPEITRSVCTKDKKETFALLNKAFEFGLLLCIPTSVGLAIAHKYVVFSIFGQSSMSYEELISLSKMIFFFAFAIPSSILSNIALSFFFASGNTSIPLKATFGSLLANIFSNLIFIKKLGKACIPLSTTMSGMINLMILVYYMRKKFGFSTQQETIAKTKKIFFCSLFMGASLYIADISITLIKSISTLNSHTKLSIMIGVGVLSYFFAILKIFKAYSLKEIFNLLDAKNKKQIPHCAKTQ